MLLLFANPSYWIYGTSIDMTLLGGQTITFTTVPTELAMNTIVPIFCYYCMLSSKENLLSSTSVLE